MTTSRGRPRSAQVLKLLDRTSVIICRRKAHIIMWHSKAEQSFNTPLLHNWTIGSSPLPPPHHSSTSGKHSLPPHPASLSGFYALRFSFFPSLVQRRINSNVDPRGQSINISFNNGWKCRIEETGGEEKEKNGGELLDCNEQVAGVEYRFRRWTQGRPHSSCLYRTRVRTTRTISVLSLTVNDKHKISLGLFFQHWGRQAVREPGVWKSNAGVSVSCLVL